MRPRQASMTRFSIERVFLGRRSSPQTKPQQYSLRISWKGALKASTEAIDRLTYSSPSTALRLARPLSLNALSISDLPRVALRLVQELFGSLLRRAQAPDRPLRASHAGLVLTSRAGRPS